MSGRDYRPLNVRDALSYLDKVKVSTCFAPLSLTTLSIAELLEMQLGDDATMTCIPRLWFLACDL
jgi:hypothetical protein